MLTDKLPIDLLMCVSSHRKQIRQEQSSLGMLYTFMDVNLTSLDGDNLSVTIHNYHMVLMMTPNNST